MQKILRSKCSQLLRADSLPPGTLVHYFYKSSKHTEPVEWRSGTVITTKEHFVTISNEKGRQSNVAYEDIRLIPKLKLTKELSMGSVEQFIGEKQSKTPCSSQPSLHGDLDDTPTPMAENVHDAPYNVEPVSDESPPLHPGEKDIRNLLANAQNLDNIDGKNLSSDLQTVLKAVQSEIGSRQVTISSLEFAPDWLIDDSIKSELDTNWIDAYTSIPLKELPKSANIIGSHFVFKIKEDESHQLKMKARLVLHGNRDRDRYSVRRDSASADLSIVRLIILLAIILGFEISTADVKGAYMQSGPIQREIYVRPPSRINTRQNTVWKLQRLPYGIVEAGRQWLCAIETWMTSVYKTGRVPGVEQLFYKKGENGRLELLIAKVLDDFFMAGFPSAVGAFTNALNNRFQLGHVGTGPGFKFLGCDICKNSAGDLRLSMTDYLQRINPIPVSKLRRNNVAEKASDAETRSFRSLAGTLLYMGQATLPQASYTASKMQQRLGSLLISDIVDANAMTRELKNLRPTILFPVVNGIQDVTIVSFSDASHAGLKDVYGQTGVLTGLKVIASERTLFYPILWTSHKQKKVCYSSYEAEILAAADADDRGYHLKESMKSLFPDRELKHELFLDSKSLFESITTLHQTGDYRLRKNSCQDERQL